ncbi:hypothetical protein [Streptomyces sp. NPDC057682]|uniref:hypothetical protein n=1 Tax=unclassified Streptomyces TaxID=2593676 RepID=UPI0036606E1B
MKSDDSPTTMVTAASRAQTPAPAPLQQRRTPLATRAALGPSSTVARLFAHNALTVSAFQSSV